MKKYTFNDFNKEFPSDSACLDWLFYRFYPGGIVECKNCKRMTKHHRVRSRPSYSCDFCGNHVHPTAGTIFHKSPTSLRLWYYAIYLMASTRSGISAKQLERELGVTYKTAWRMFRQIRSMMGSDGDRLSGIVEIDETYVGGVQKGKVGRPTPTDKKKPVLGMVERGGRVRAAVVKEVSTPGMIEYIRGNVEKGSKIMTDELNAYNVLRRVGYDHSRIHHRTEYVRGNIHTNSVEGFWSQLKLGLRGVYRQVSPKYLQSYADEYAFRYSHRNHDDSMFMLLLRRV